MSAAAGSLGDAATAPDLLRAEAVGVTMAGRVLLGPTSLAFTRGTVTGIIGHNGSGKTTLLRCLARQHEPTEGRVTLGDRPVSEWGARPFARRLAFLPQHLPAATGLTVRELVAMGRYPWHGPLGRIGPHGLAAVEDALALSGTVPFAGRLVDELSGGERQRAWIAMLIAQETGFVVLDEPIAALDLAQQVAVLGLLRDLARRRHAGIILVLHDINMAARFCDTLVALRGGHVMAAGAPSDLLQPAMLERIFALPMRVLADRDSPHGLAVPA